MMERERHSGGGAKRVVKRAAGRAAKGKGFSDEERAAMKDYLEEKRGAGARGRGMRRRRCGR